jgi:hypothetical protein
MSPRRILPIARSLCACLVAFACLSAGAVETIFTKQTYATGGKFGKGTETVLTKGPNGVSQRSIRPNRLVNACGATMMAVDQAYSLERMREIGYLSEEEYEFYSNLASGLETDQVVFFHQYRELRKSELDRLPREELEKIRKLVDSRLGGTIDIELDHALPFEAQTGSVFAQLLANTANPRMRVKDASLYLVRGQGWDRYLKRRIHDLPWMKETAFSHAPRLSRFETPLAWELGRAAKSDAGNIEELLRLAAVEMANEARIHGVDPAKAKVFVHARDRAHRILYEGRYGFRFVAESSERAGDVVLEIPLSDLLTRYPETRTVARLRAIELASRGVLSGEKAARAHAAFSQEIFQALDVAEGESLQSKPIVLFNELYDVGGLVGEELVRLGMPRVQSEETYRSMMEVLTAMHGGFRSTLNLDESMVADDLVKTSLLEEKRKTLRIYNLDETAIDESPDLVLRTLVGVREYYQKRVDLFHSRNDPGTRIRTPVYSIVTTSAKIRDHALALGGELAVRPYHPAETAFTKGGRIAVDGKYGDAYHIVFEDSAITELMRRHESVARRARNLFRIGKWQELYRLHSGVVHY